MIHNIALGNTVKSRRTKDVETEPTAGSNTLGDDGDDGQLEIDISDSEAKAELEAAAAEPEPEPGPQNRNSNSSVVAIITAAR